MTEEDYMKAALTVVRSGGKPRIPCKNCAMPFTITKRTIKKRFCSTKCRVAYSRSKNNAAAENSA